MFFPACGRHREALFRTLLSFLAFSFIVVAARPAGAQLASDSPFRLIGVIESRSFMGAVLDDSTGKQSFYRLREELPDGSRIVKVENDSILLRRSDGTTYELFIIHMKPSAQQAAVYSGSSPAPAAAAAPFPVPRPERRFYGGEGAPERGPWSRRRDAMQGPEGQQNQAGPGQRGGGRPDFRERRHGRQ